MLKQHLLWLPMLTWVAMVQAVDESAIKQKLEVMMPGISIDSIQAMDNTGLYEVIIDGEILYFSEDMRYAFQGDVISLESRQNITETKRISLKKQALASLNEADLIIYSPKKTEHTLTVFTDIDCGYCRKLHRQMDEYNALGIRIRYMAYPRAGIDSGAYDKIVDVWCADDRKQAMTDAKQGRNIASENCNNPVRDQYQLGRRLGVSGTPALFLDSGELLPGYIPPKRLKTILNERALTGS